MSECDFFVLIERYFVIISSRLFFFAAGKTEPRKQRHELSSQTAVRTHETRVSVGPVG